MNATTVRIALFNRPNGRTTQHTRISLQGEFNDAEALKRAYTIVQADRNIHRDYLLNCLDIGNFSITKEST